MDQGWAAVIAAAFGLVGAVGGAVAGGYAAIRGAREGAERSARAALEQAARQAQDQHDQWLRQERRVAYADMIQDVRDFRDNLAKLLTSVSDPRDERATLEALQGTMTAQLQLIQRIGPVVTIAGRNVMDAFQVFVAGSRQACKQLMGRQPFDLPPEEVRALYEATAKTEALLTVVVATEIQAGPMTRQPETDQGGGDSQARQNRLNRNNPASPAGQ